MEKIPITNERGQSFYLQRERLIDISKELEEFCNSTLFSTSSSFPREILFTQELKSNNAIEGYYEDLSSIIRIINNPYLDKDMLDKEYLRILNLYSGYKYIIENNIIDEVSLNKLYKILSNRLLSDEEKLKDGALYRDSDVYIYYSSNLEIPPDKGFEPSNIKYHMDNLFEYINTNNDLPLVDLFFKSLIIHFYMVIIHPYFDVNGRTSRTTSLWFLNSNETYPYTIFNRGITYNKDKYHKYITETKRHRNITPFLEFIASKTKIELEKEYIIRCIGGLSKAKLSPIDKQVLQYILENNSQNTLIDIQNLYNRFNPKARLKYVDQELMESLFEKGIILKKGQTKKGTYEGNFNYTFSLNPKYLDFDKEKVKRLSIDKLYR